MSDTCFACEYKALARRAISELLTVSRLIGFVDLNAQDTFVRVAEGLRREMLALHIKQQRDTEDAAMRMNGSCSPW